MQKKNLIPVILLSISCILFLAAIIIMLNSNSFSFKNSTGKSDTNTNTVKEEIPNKNTNKVESNTNSNNQNNNLESTNTSDKTETIKTPNTSSNEVNSSVNENTNVNTNTNTNNPVNTSKPVQSENTEGTISKNENTIISYFKNQEVNTFSNVDQDDRTLREKAKSVFTGIVDFIFYDKEVKGYKFKELTNSAKLQIIKIALSIDSKIDQYFPDYKDVMKDKYSNIKGKLAVKYLEFTSSLCENVGADTCNQAKEDFNKMKESFGFTWQLIKELASSGSTKVKEFYESWRDSE